MLFAAAFSIIGYYIPMLLVTQQAKNPEWGVSPTLSKYLVTFFGIANTIGRFVSGRLGDYGHYHKAFSSFFLYIIGHVVSAAALLVFPHFMWMGDLSFVSFIAIYGVFIAPLVTMRSIIVCEMYGKHNAKASFGWFLSVQGLVQVIGFVIPSKYSFCSVKLIKFKLNFFLFSIFERYQPTTCLCFRCCLFLIFCCLCSKYMADVFPCRRCRNGFEAGNFDGSDHQQQRTE